MTLANEWDDWIHKFLEQWFSGLFLGLEKQSEKIQQSVLSQCGIACAHPQAVDFFQKTWDNCRDINHLLTLVNKRYQKEVFTQGNGNIIHVNYHKCYCPFVELNLPISGVLCECSRYWLKEIFERTLEKPIEVRLIQTIARGAKMCKFDISY